MSEHFPDQPIVKGADVIYRPAGEAGEYAPLATNPYVGCGHACFYCYVPAATHISREKFDAGAVPREGYLERLARDVLRHTSAGVGIGHPAEQVFVTFSSDPFHGGDLSHTEATLELLLTGGMAFSTLSKGGTRALDFLHLYRPGRDAYACTLTTTNAALSTKWERRAALPWDRIEALRKFRQAGIFTWVSLEPTLSAEASLEIVRQTHEFVDLYKIGRANYVKDVVKGTDWRDYTLRMLELLNAVGARHYIKRSLQAHLPAGYFNPLRVAQHH